MLMGVFFDSKMLFVVNDMLVVNFIKTIMFRVGKTHTKSYGYNGNIIFSQEINNNCHYFSILLLFF